MEIMRYFFRVKNLGIKKIKTEKIGRTGYKYRSCMLVRRINEAKEVRSKVKNMFDRVSFERKNLIQMGIKQEIKANLPQS
jgi:Zn-finger protein